MEPAPDKEGVAGVDGFECLAHANFKEIQNLVSYVTKTLLPTISKLEVTVEELMDKIERMEEGRTAKRPRFYLGETETDDEGDGLDNGRAYP
jgi:transposase-like protein